MRRMDRGSCITPKDYALLKQAANELGYPIAYALIVMAYNSGMEMIPLLQLEWTHIDFNKMEIHQDCKVTIPIQTGGELHHMLLSLAHTNPRRCQWVIYCNSSDELINRRAQAYYQLRYIIKATGLNVQFSDLRQAFMFRAIKGSHSFGSMPTLPDQVELAETWENSKPREPEPVAKSPFPKIVTPPEIR